RAADRLELPTDRQILEEEAETHGFHFSFPSQWPSGRAKQPKNGPIVPPPSPAEDAGRQPLAGSVAFELVEIAAEAVEVAVEHGPRLAEIRRVDLDHLRRRRIQFRTALLEPLPPDDLREPLIRPQRGHTAGEIAAKARARIERPRIRLARHFIA